MPTSVGNGMKDEVQPHLNVKSLASGSMVPSNPAKETPRKGKLVLKMKIKDEKVASFAKSVVAKVKK